MMDYFYRRSEYFICGTLLGRIDFTHVDITNCYAVPFLSDERLGDDKIEDVKAESK